MDNLEERWGTSGLAWLTGTAEHPDFSRSPILGGADGVTRQIRQLIGVDLDAATVLTDRAALAGLQRRGRISAGGATRLLRARGQWCALTLSRPDDVHAVPALVECAGDLADPWSAVSRWIGSREASEFIDRCGLLELTAAVLGESTGPAVARTSSGTAIHPRGVGGLLVTDLTSMWAGPLCGRILAAAGATVVKVEARSRPDGTRRGEPAFFDLVNAGKLSYALDLDSDSQRLRQLLSVSDIVLEGSRPRALIRRGLSSADIPGPAGRVWVRITGHGSQSDRAAFGDDAAVAGGLVGRSVDGPVFCADAVADPLTGLEAALAVAQSLSRGGGESLEVSMAGVAARYAALPFAERRSRAEVRPPTPPPASAPGPACGADNVRVERLIDERLAAC